MEFFLEPIQTLLPVLGYDFLRPRPSLAAAAQAISASTAAPNVSPVFVREVRKHAVRARGQEIDGEFVVFKGSIARKEWTGNDTAYGKLFRRLLELGVLRPTADNLHTEFTEDHAFASPSAAAAVVAGRSSNGRTAWVIEGTGTTYGEWQSDQVSKVAPEPLPAEAPTVAPVLVDDGEA